MEEVKQTGLQNDMSQNACAKQETIFYRILRSQRNWWRILSATLNFELALARDCLIDTAAYYISSNNICHSAYKSVSIFERQPKLYSDLFDRCIKRITARHDAIRRWCIITVDCRVFEDKKEIGAKYDENLASDSLECIYFTDVCS